MIRILATLEYPVKTERTEWAFSDIESNCSAGAAVAARFLLLASSPDCSCGQPSGEQRRGNGDEGVAVQGLGLVQVNQV